MLHMPHFELHLSVSCSTTAASFMPSSSKLWGVCSMFCNTQNLIQSCQLPKEGCRRVPQNVKAQSKDCKFPETCIISGKTQKLSGGLFRSHYEAAGLVVRHVYFRIVPDVCPNNLQHLPPAMHRDTSCLDAGRAVTCTYPDDALEGPTAPSCRNS